MSVDVYLKDTKIRANFQGNGNAFNVEGDFTVRQFSIKNEQYVMNKLCQADLNLTFENDSFAIHRSQISIERSRFYIDGFYYFGKHSFVNLGLSGDNLHLEKLFLLLPEDLQKKYTHYKIEGMASISLHVAGKLKPDVLPGLDIKVKIWDGDVTEKHSGIRLNNIAFTALFKNKEGHEGSDFLQVSDLMAQIGKGSLSGNIQIRNLKHPQLHGYLVNELDLREIKDFFSMDSVEIFQGKEKGKISFDGKLQSLDKISDISSLNFKGNFQIKDGAFKLKGSNFSLNAINGLFKIDSSVYLNDVQFLFQDNDFLINGTLTNGVRYFLKEPDVQVALNATVSSHHLDLSNYFNSASNSIADNSQQQYSREFLFPDNVEINVKLSVDQFKLHEFKAINITGNISYRPKIFTLKSISFETMGGKVSGNGLVLQDVDKNFITKDQLDLKNLDIHELFYEFHNFGQAVIVSDNLQGKLSGLIGLSDQWNSSLDFNPEKCLVDADFMIENGQLINFAPMKGLSRFIALDELKNIRFSTLKNRIFIHDKQIIIPQMDVCSSAFSIIGSGNHSFDNHYSYKVSVQLSDILWGKAKRHKKENEDFGITQSEHVSKVLIPISITGYNSDYKISYDTKDAFERSKKRREEQKAEMKEILNDEFGWYNNDSTKQLVKTTKPVCNSRISWDEDDQQLRTLSSVNR